MPRPISTKVHGTLDYVVGMALTAVPTVLQLEKGSAAALAPRLQGAGAGVYSLFTDYERGVRRVIPMRAHLALDVMGGLALAAVPWLSGDARKGRRYWLPHLLAGSGEVAIALATQRQPAGRDG